MIRIDQGVAFSKRGAQRYPWAQMSVGDSFYLAKTTTNPYALAWTASRANAPKRFVCRAWEDGYRIWRVQ